MNTQLPSSILQIVSDCSDSDRGLSLKGLPFSKANKGFMVAAFSVVRVAYLANQRIGKNHVTPINEVKIREFVGNKLFLKRLRHVLILKTCFDVANIIVSYKIFEKLLDFITTRRNIHN